MKGLPGAIQIAIKINSEVAHVYRLPLKRMQCRSYLAAKGTVSEFFGECGIT